MKAILIVTLALAFGCTDQLASSTTEQAICTIEDQQNGACPDARSAVNAYLDSFVAGVGQAPSSRTVDCTSSDYCAGAVQWWNLLGQVECWEIDTEIICYAVIQ